jgi:hypothetical protein
MLCPLHVASSAVFGISIRLSLVRQTRYPLSCWTDCALEDFPGLLVGLIEGLARIRQSSAEHRPRFGARLFQILQSCIGLRCVRFHMRDSRIDLRTLGGRDFSCLGLQLISCLAPSFHLRGSCISEIRLSLLELTADRVEIGVDLCLEAFPTLF